MEWIACSANIYHTEILFLFLSKNNATALDDIVYDSSGFYLLADYLTHLESCIRYALASLFYVHNINLFLYNKFMVHNHSLAKKLHLAVTKNEIDNT